MQRISNASGLCYTTPTPTSLMNKVREISFLLWFRLLFCFLDLIKKVTVKQNFTKILLRLQNEEMLAVQLYMEY